MDFGSEYYLLSARKERDSNLFKWYFKIGTTIKKLMILLYLCKNTIEGACIVFLQRSQGGALLEIVEIVFRANMVLHYRLKARISLAPFVSIPISLI